MSGTVEVSKRDLAALLRRSLVNSMEAAILRVAGGETDFRSASNEVSCLIILAIECAASQFVQLLATTTPLKMFVDHEGPLAPGAVARRAQARVHRLRSNSAPLFYKALTHPGPSSGRASCAVMRVETWQVLAVERVPLR